MSDTLRVLFVIPGFARGSTFVETDRAILAQHFPTTTLVRESRDRLFPARVLKHLRKHDVAVTWFADTHAYWTMRAGRALKKPVCVIPGQYEFANYPEAGYGLVLESPKRWRQATAVAARADLILAVSRYHQSIIAAAAPARRGETRLLYHGFDLRDYERPDGVRKRPMVLTVAHCGSAVRVWLKGLETFAQAAALLPDIRFVLAGGYDPVIAAHLQELAAGSLELTGALSPVQVAQLAWQAQAYAQLSATETFGCALAEAMLCECVPVVTDRGSLPEVAGEVGYYTRYGDVEQTVCQIERALASGRGPAARRRIQEEFPLAKREQGLVEAVQELAARS
jgi:glycosyltransferase involved in cell wall biosynthesis